ncbi:MAG: acyltransferase [Bacteroidetes bacterium]|nr:acyltransferase [Bacteroidota bacterium]
MIVSALKAFYFESKTRYYTFLARRKVHSSGKGLRVNYKCFFTRKTIIGEDCHFNGISVVGDGKLIIQDHFHSGSEIIVITQSHNYFRPQALPYDNTDILRDVIIGKCCWIGTRVTILPGTVIEDGVVVQAGAVVFGKVPKYAVIGGNPWKILKYRDSEVYDRLERDGKYV